MGVKAEFQAAVEAGNYALADTILTDAFVPVIQNRINQQQGQGKALTLTRGTTTVTVMGCWAQSEGDRTWLAFWLRAIKDGAPVNINNPVLFRYPPHADTGAELLALAEQMLLDVVG